MAEKRRGLAGTGVWVLPHIFAPLSRNLVFAMGVAEKRRQGFAKGGRENIFQALMCVNVPRCIHEKLSVDGNCRLCLNDIRADGFIMGVPPKRRLSDGMTGSLMQT